MQAVFARQSDTCVRIHEIKADGAGRNTLIAMRPLYVLHRSMPHAALDLDKHIRVGALGKVVSAHRGEQFHQVGERYKRHCSSVGVLRLSNFPSE
jgi:hypothetical protein